MLQMVLSSEKETLTYNFSDMAKTLEGTFCLLVICPGGVPPKDLIEQLMAVVNEV